MQYGYYDEKNREYVISRPLTPLPWTNILGTPSYAAVISHNAGGGSFRQSMKLGRILRDGRPPFDTPGRYIYIRDNKSRDYWTTSWQPVGKDLHKYISECRHGLGYTTMRAEYDEIRSDVLYYVPRDKDYEVWYVNIANRSQQIRHLTITGFAEFTNCPDQVQEAAGSARYISRTHFENNRIVQTLGENAEGPCLSRFFGLAGAETASYCGDLSAFLGLYRGYQNPLGVERGDLKGKLNYNEDSCGALSTVAVLAPGESVDMAFVLGEKTDKEAEDILKLYQKPQAACLQDWLALKNWWEDRLARLQVQTPDTDFNQMVNTWDPLGTWTAYLWNDELGFGESERMADILPGLMITDPDQVLAELRRLLSAQKMEGGDAAFRLIPSVLRWICETGRMEFLDEQLSYADGWNASVYDHLKRAVDLPERRFGPHGLLFPKHTCQLLPPDAESVLSTMRLYAAMGDLMVLAGEKGETEYQKELKEKRAKLKDVLDQAAFREDRYLYGILADGTEIGSGKSLEASLWLRPQLFAMLCGLADEKRAQILRKRIQEELDTPYGARRMTPPIRHSLYPGMEGHLTNAFAGENGSILCSQQADRLLMETRQGHGDTAYVVWKTAAPAPQNDASEIRRREPYCYGTFVESIGSPHAGHVHGSWLSPAAASMSAAVAEGMLGIVPGLRDITFSPCLPSVWEEVKVDRIWRGKKLHVVMKNPVSAKAVVKSLRVNGETVSGNKIPYDMLREENEIQFVLG